jgi:GAF domain/Pyridoxamine 5'-phosphate oxidase
VSELSPPLESLLPCFQGVTPSWLATCSADGVPNVTLLSIVHYVDSERVALTRQFFNKTSANLDGNPQAQAMVINPETVDQYLLDLRFLHTETEGPIFDAVAVNLDAVASQTGMAGVFRLRGVDIHRVLAVHPFGETTQTQAAPARDRIAALDEYVRRLADCPDYARAARTGLEALDDLFDFRHSILLAADERGDRVFAIASNGYANSAAGAEVAIGVGVIGIAAQRRRVVTVPSTARSRAMHTAIVESVERSGGELEATEIPLPGLGDVRSAAAVPLVTHGELAGVLYLESDRAGDFSQGDERLLRILGGHLAATMAVLSADRSEAAADPTPTAVHAATGRRIALTYYQADDSCFVDGSYVIKGVPGRILWRLASEHVADGRTDFTNRELRLDERLGLPYGNDNLEARLLVLRRRLESQHCGIVLERVGRGRLALGVEAPLVLSEVATKGPMRAAHEPLDAG